MMLMARKPLIYQALRAIFGGAAAALLIAGECAKKYVAPISGLHFRRSGVNLIKLC